jgi:hypothetical protein
MAAIKRLMSGLNYELEDGKCHKKLVFFVGEIKHKIAIPSSPSDSGRGLKNFKADLQRKLKGDTTCVA